MKSLFIVALLSLLLSTGMMPQAWAEESKASPKAEGGGKEKESGKKEEGEKEKSKGPADVSGGRFAGDPVYVHLAPMILPVITQVGSEQIITLQIAIEVKDFDAADSVHSNMPRVMDSLMRALYGGLGSGELRNGQLIDVTKIKSKAIAALGEAVGADNIRDVLIEAVAQRKL